jgi:aspartate 1-decarboxylase
MKRMMLRAKLHRLSVTGRSLEYEGSLTVDSALLEAADILPGERVQIVNINNGARFETYVLEGKKGSGVVCLNGAAARLAEIGDLIIVIAYAIVDETKLAKFKPKIVLVDKENQIKK